MAALWSILPRRSKCRGWLPQPEKESHPLFHDPGDCRQCWRPCHSTRRPGTSFCDDCWEQYARHRAVKIRYAVLSRHDIPLEWLRFLADDQEAVIADAAEERLNSYGEDEADDGDEMFDEMYSSPRRGARKRR